MNLDIHPRLANMATLESIIIERIKEKQKDDPKMAKILDQIATRLGFEVVDGVLYFRGRLCVPDVDGLRGEIMTEAHQSRYFIHPGSRKMFQNLRERYWWNNMKREIAGFVSKCLLCQKVKAEHRKPPGKLKPLEIQYGSGSISLWILYLVYRRCPEFTMQFG